MALSRISMEAKDRDTFTEVGSRTPQRFLDFVIDGRPLQPEIQQRGFDTITPLWLDGGSARAFATRSVQLLLGEIPGDAPQGRVSLYVCSECGDLGCGAVTVRLAVSEDIVEWSDWGYQNNYDDDIYRDSLDDLPALTFARDQYQAALRASLRLISGQDA
jgi:hypothetical protein